MREIEKLNHTEGLTVEQYAIKSDGVIVGGFTIYTDLTRPYWAMMGGLHIKPEFERQGITWIFHALKPMYPTVRELHGYRSTGRKRGPSFLRWRTK
jgi:hypothetical protein